MPRLAVAHAAMLLEPTHNSGAQGKLGECLLRGLFNQNLILMRAVHVWDSLEQ